MSPRASKGFQGLPRVANGWQGLPRVAKGIQWLPLASMGCQGLARFVKGLQGLPIRAPMADKGCQQLPKVAEGCQGLPRASKGFQGLPRVSKASKGFHQQRSRSSNGCQRLPRSSGAGSWAGSGPSTAFSSRERAHVAPGLVHLRVSGAHFAPKLRTTCVPDSGAALGRPPVDRLLGHDRVDPIVVPSGVVPSEASRFCGAACFGASAFAGEGTPPLGGDYCVSPATVLEEIAGAGIARAGSGGR